MEALGIDGQKSQIAQSPKSKSLRQSRKIESWIENVHAAAITHIAKSFR
jgi:hypothetical protein